jgi:hypothetical protein
MFTNKSVKITDAVDENRDCFKIETVSAIYFLDKKGGGFSSVLDMDGNDWINWRKGFGAGGEWRGFPNSVYLQDPAHNGTGHPGFDNAISEMDGTNKIQTRSGENWHFTYEFFDTHVTLTVNKSQHEKAYWILYEGTPGGAYDKNNPDKKFWGTEKGVRSEIPIGNNNAVVERMKFAYFGDKSMNRSMVIIRHNDTEKVMDQMYYLDASDSPSDGMTVFGFGRINFIPLHQSPNTFTLAMMETKEHKKINAFVNTILKNA